MTNETNVNTETVVEKDELTLLKERADMMGIKYHPAIGVKSLKEKLDEELSGKKESDGEVVVGKGEESILERNARLRKEANQLVRIQLTCMNPAKNTWKGDFYEVSNSVIGSIKKFVPFNVEEDGYHVPAVSLKMLKRKKFQKFYEIQKGRHKVKKSKLVPEFGITVLDPLTREELKKLAQVQAASHNID